MARQVLLPLQLLKIIQRKVHVDSSWRECLKKAAILVGKKPQPPTTPPTCLLVEHDRPGIVADSPGRQKYTDAIYPRGLEAFLGVGRVLGRKEVRGENSSGLPSTMQKTLVHEGDASGVTEELLLFTDDLMLNLFFNLTRHPKLFNSKEAVVEFFADRVKAERVLGLKGKVRPKTLRALTSRYEEKTTKVL